MEYMIKNITLGLVVTFVLSIALKEASASPPAARMIGPHTFEVKATGGLNKEGQKICSYTDKWLVYLYYKDKQGVWRQECHNEGNLVPNGKVMKIGCTSQSENDHSLDYSTTHELRVGRYKKDGTADALWTPHQKKGNRHSFTAKRDSDCYLVLK